MSPTVRLNFPAPHQPSDFQDSPPHQSSRTSPPPSLFLERTDHERDTSPLPLPPHSYPLPRLQRRTRQDGPSSDRNAQRNKLVRVSQRSLRNARPERQGRRGRDEERGLWRTVGRCKLSRYACPSERAGAGRRRVRSRPTGPGDERSELVVGSERRTERDDKHAQQYVEEEGGRANCWDPRLRSGECRRFKFLERPPRGVSYPPSRARNAWTTLGSFKAAYDGYARGARTRGVERWGSQLPRSRRPGQQDCSGEARSRTHGRLARELLR